ncbi:MAG: tetratricopeptide repeat protein [Bdellovibrionales bacterium]
MNRYIVALLGLTVMVGCLKTRAELEAEETGKVQERQTISQQKSAAPAAKASHVGGQSVKAPPPADRSEEMDEQMRNLSGRVEANEAAVQQMHVLEQQKKEAWIKDQQMQSQKLQAYEDAIRKLEAQVQALSEEVAHLKAPPPEPAAAPAKGGKNSFETGEELFTGKKWKEAIVSFQKYRDQNPKGKQYADATYKIGVCFQEIGMKDEAKSFMEEVTAKFPNSKEAKKAAFRLKSLGSAR